MKISNLKIVLTGTTLAAIMLSGCAPRKFNTEEDSGSQSSSLLNSDSVISEIRGLNKLNIDEWTKGLANNKCATEPTNFSTSIEKAIKTNTSVDGLFKSIVELKYHCKYNQYSSYVQLAEALLSNRKHLRRDTASPYQRASLILLQMLAEESLYIGYTQFSPKEKIWTAIYHKASGSECTKTAKLTEFSVCPGDVVLSKGGAGSSSFIARTPDYPGNFSHSTTVYIDQDKKLWLPESEIEDGNKLRNPEKDYVTSAKKKLYVYRYYSGKFDQDVKVRKKAEQGVLKIVKQMNDNTNNAATTVSSFPYDFNMDAKDHTALFCSEVAHYVYKLGEATDAENPYPPNLWGTTSDVRGLFFTQFMKVPNSTYPSPSDIELNPAFDIVGFSIDISKLGEDRIDVALMDVLQNYMISHEDYTKKYLQVFDNLGNLTVTKENLDKIKKFILTTKLVAEDKIDELIAKMPENINIRQAVFFHYLNNVLTPAVRTKIQANNVIIGPTELRKNIYDIAIPKLKDLLDLLPKNK